MRQYFVEKLALGLGVLGKELGMTTRLNFLVLEDNSKIRCRFCESRMYASCRVEALELQECGGCEEIHEHLTSWIYVCSGHRDDIDLVGSGFWHLLLRDCAPLKAEGRLPLVAS